MTWRLRNEDIRFLLGTFAPNVNPDEVAELDEAWLEEVLESDTLANQILQAPYTLLGISPWLFFNVLLRKVRRDLAGETYTRERRARQQLVIFDTDKAIELLDQAPIRDYLAALLASFTRIASMTVRVNIGPGMWRRYRTNDLDVEGLIRYAEAVDEPLRFEPYKRIGDVCLFLAGMFPEYLENQYRYPLSRQVRPGARGKVLQSREDYERFGRAFYEMAAEHERAQVGGLDEVLTTLSEAFLVAEKPLAFLSNRYLWQTRHQLFGL